MEPQVRCAMLGLALLAGCTNQPIRDAAARCTKGVFSYRVEGLQENARTEVARCTIQATQLHVLQVAGLVAGSAILTIKDVTGKEVYSRDASQALSGYTAEGTAGEWVFQVQTIGATGKVEFAVIP